MLELSCIDQAVSDHSYFCLLDWLLAENLIAYGDYEDWRYSKLSTLDEQIKLDRAELDQLFQHTEALAESLGLSNELQDYYSWQSETQQALRAADNRDKHRQLTQHWLRAQDLPQLDLFMDNAAVIAENLLTDALSARQWTLAKQQLAQLGALNPNHRRLGRYQDILNYGEHMHARPQIETEVITGEFYGLQQEVSPLAREILGASARDYLAFAWRRLADNLAGSRFNPAHPQIHRSYALLQIPDWQAIEHILVDDSQLYQYPQLLETLSASYAMQNKSALALLLWCLLAEKHSDYFEDVIDKESNKDQPIYRLWDSFGELSDALPTSFFPAFVLLKQPGLTHHKEACGQLESRASQGMIHLLQCRLANENEISAREQLQAVSPALLRLYLELKYRGSAEG
jgi:hypothetical protein